MGRLESASPDPAKRRSTLRACSVEEGCAGDCGWVGLMLCKGDAALAAPPRSHARAASAGGGRGPHGTGTPSSSNRRWGISSLSGVIGAGTAIGESSHRCETASWGAGWLAWSWGQAGREGEMGSGTPCSALFRRSSGGGECGRVGGSGLLAISRGEGGERWLVARRRLYGAQPACRPRHAGLSAACARASVQG